MKERRRRRRRLYQQNHQHFAFCLKNTIQTKVELGTVKERTQARQVLWEIAAFFHHTETLSKL